MDTVETLRLFCSSEYPALMYPWSAGRFSYSSDGVILVRLPRITTIPETGDGSLRTEEIERYFAREPEKWVSVDSLMIFNREVEQECGYCSGTGVVNFWWDGPEDEKKEFPSVCPSCVGIGSQWDADLMIEGIVFDIRFLYHISLLFRCELGSVGSSTVPARFRFWGGEGLIMPVAKGFREDTARRFPS
jgi:hypothetical protein